MSKVQSVLFDKKFWTIIRAKNWLEKSGFISTKVHETKKYLRFRQYNPNNEKYRIKKISESIKFVIGIPR